MTALEPETSDKRTGTFTQGYQALAKTFQINTEWYLIKGLAGSPAPITNNRVERYGRSCIMEIPKKGAQILR